MEFIKKYFFCALLSIGVLCVNAQGGVYIPVAGKIFFTGDTATIFSNVINKGNVGLAKNAVVNFAGKSWENDPQSLITDESNGGDGTTGTGGWVRFLSNSFRQQLIGGYNAATKTGPAFSNLKIENNLGVELFQSSAKVRKEFNFTSGHVYLQTNIMVVGDNDPGKINGYDSLRYFVTGNNQGGGLLLRENINRSNGQVVFPVGSKENSYTPAAIRSLSSQRDDYYVTVLDSVKSGVFTGNNLSNESVNKTWQIGKRWRPDLDEVEIALQHLNADEEAGFNFNRRNAYAAQFTGGSWDEGYPQSLPVSGYLTTGTVLANSGVNSRIFNATLSGNSYFTKLTGKGDTTKTRLWFNAYRLDTGNVKVYWNTNPEINVKYFVVQRRLSNETNFTSRDTVLSMATAGYSISDLSYTTNDANNYQGISFYRLRIVDFANNGYYSDTVAVGNKPGIYSILLWPNPTPNIFFISIHKNLPVKAIVIYNVLGQKMMQEDVNGRTFIQMQGLIPGTYFVSFVLTTGTIIETKKLVVAGE
jgi:hypothetical protein